MSDRRSRWFPSAPTKWVSSFQTQLLYEDFHNAVVPYRREPEAYDVSSEGIPSYALEESLTLGEHGRGLDGFVRAIASRLLTRHEAWIEVAFEDDGGRRSAPFRVCEVDGVTRTPAGDLIQSMPAPEELPEWYSRDVEWEREIELDPNRMIHVTLPDAYPGQLLNEVVRGLAAIELEITPPWVMEHWTGQRPDVPPYDVSEAIRTQRLRVAQAALPIGWTGREIFLGSNRELGDYHHYWRELRFLHFRASMRERAEEALRQILALASQRCRFDVRVTAHGIHTPDQVRAVIEAFEVGELAFSTINDVIFENADGAAPQTRRVV